MTSLAFGFGVLPLAISSGAGSGSQHAIGTGVLGGTIAGTLLGLMLSPQFYVAVMRVFKPKPVESEAIAASATQEVKG